MNLEVGKDVESVTLARVGPKGEQFFAWGDRDGDGVWLHGRARCAKACVGDRGKLVYSAGDRVSVYRFEKAT